VGLGLTDLPVPGEKSNLSPAALDVLGALLALLALGALAYVLRGRAPAPPAERRAASAASVTAALDAPAPAALLRALAKLDADHAAGTIENAPYQVQRTALKAELTTRVLATAGAGAAGAEARR
jgi:hypothetical protein